MSEYTYLSDTHISLIFWMEENANEREIRVGIWRWKRGSLTKWKKINSFYDYHVKWWIIRIPREHTARGLWAAILKQISDLVLIVAVRQSEEKTNTSLLVSDTFMVHRAPAQQPFFMQKEVKTWNLCSKPLRNMFYTIIRIIRAQQHQISNGKPHVHLPWPCTDIPATLRLPAICSLTHIQRMSFISQIVRLADLAD